MMSFIHPIVVAIVAVLSHAAFAQDDPGAPPGGVYDLPTTSGPARAIAVVYSGDGGWQDLDKTIGEWLTGQSFAVVGISTLTMFWNSREPPEVAATLEKLVSDADPTGKLPVLLIGYSFGADLLPFAWPELSPAMRERVRLLAMLAPETTTEFHVSVEGWLGIETGDHSVIGAMGALPPDKVMCVYGEEEEDDTPCKEVVLPRMQIVRTAGGHHFDEDYIALGRRILAGFDARAATPAPAGAAAEPPTPSPVTPAPPASP